MKNKIVGGEVMIIGDLHFSDVFTGKHKNYLSECFLVLRDLTNIIDDRRPSAVVLLGDIVGWNETNIRDRQVFSMFCKTLKSWNKVCPVYAVRGNHDLKGYPDFNFLEEFELVITSTACGGYFDYYGMASQEVPEIRFHLVNYMDEDRHLDILEGTSNVVLGHNNYTINGVTTWYPCHDGIELGLHGNYSGVDMVISGHIHNPSPEISSVIMASGKDCMLFYPGCPTRPVKEREIYETCWNVFVKYDVSSGQTDILPEVFKLQSKDEVFFSDEEFVDEKSAEEVQEEIRKDALKGVLDDLLKYRIQSGDPISQVMQIPNATEEAKKMAVGYLNAAFGVGGAVDV